MSALADLTEEERYLFAILQDQSGIDQAEFAWVDSTNQDFVFRCWDFQYPWYRTQAKFQIDQCGRAIGKSNGIQMRAWAFAFTNPAESMLLTAPEMIHLDPVTRAIEDRIMASRMSREFLQKKNTSNGITHRPFEAKFRNGAVLMGRIPQKDGKGVKGMHPKKLEMDEAQDYPEPGWVELGETLKYGEEDATWRSHGVSRGVRDRYYKQTQKESGWYVHRYTAMHRPDWTPEEREAKAEMYGSRDHPDYRRNILGLHGDSQSALFVLTRLMACFVEGTQIQTPLGAVPIESLTIGDAVHNANGVGRITARQESLRDRLVRVSLDNGEQFICTPEHPFFTEHGWCHADQLQTGFGLVGQREAVRLVRSGDHLDSRGQVLREALLRELAVGDPSGEATADADGEALRVVRGPLLPSRQDGPILWECLRGSLARSAAAEGGREALRDVRRDVHAATGDDAILLVDLSGHLGQSESTTHEAGAIEVESDERLNRRTAGASVHTLAGAWGASGGVGAAVLDESAGRAGGRDLRSVGHRSPGVQDGGRGGRAQPSVPRRAGRHDRAVALVARVADVEVLEPGCPDFDSRARLDDQGNSRVPVYDLSVGEHPSFAIGEQGVLVHNCVDQDPTSHYNTAEYHHVRINEEKLRDSQMPIEALLDFPVGHQIYERTWVGMDVGLTNHPSEILIFAEEYPARGGGRTEVNVRLKCIARIHLERISSPHQRRVLEAIWDFYRPQAISMDRTGLGLPIYQEIMGADSEAPQGMKNAMRPYNFSEKIVIGYEEPEEEVYDPDELVEIKANVLEYSSDMLRTFVDKEQLKLPWDIDMIREFQGQTYAIAKSNTDAYGKKRFNAGKFHALDAARMAVLGHLQESIDAARQVSVEEPVYDMFLV